MQGAIRRRAFARCRRGSKKSAARRCTDVERRQRPLSDARIAGLTILCACICAAALYLLMRPRDAATAMSATGVDAHLPQLQQRSPQAIDPGEYRFRLERTRCYGNCPIFVLEIDDNGMAHYDGPDLRDRSRLGLEDKRRMQRSRQLSAEDRMALARIVERGDFWRLQPKYDLQPYRDPATGQTLSLDITDNPTTILTVWRGRQSRRVSRHIVPCVRDYPGNLSGDVLLAAPTPVPDVFCVLVDAIEDRSCADYWSHQASDPLQSSPLLHDPRCEAETP